MSVELQRQVSSILIPDVDVTYQDELIFDQMFAIHVEKKKLFHDLANGEADFEEVLEALEVFIGTSNMDGYLLDVTPKLDYLCNLYGVSD